MSKKDTQFKRERRKYARLQVQIWAVEKNYSSSSFHLVTNLSIGGLFLEKKLPFKAGEIVNLELELVGETIVLQGKVVNNYENPITNQTGAGVQFIDMGAKVKAIIEHYLKSLEKNGI